MASWDVYQRIIVPQAVFDELMKLQAFGYDVQQIGGLDWIEVRQPTNLQQVLFLQLSLDAGESEAIVLSHETYATLLLIDERAGAKKRPKKWALRPSGYWACS